MRLSVDKDDPGYSEKAHEATPYLDSKEVLWVQTADEEKGYILRLKTDEKGKHIVNRNTMELVTEELYGNVKIVIEGVK